MTSSDACSNWTTRTNTKWSRKWIRSSRTKQRQQLRPLVASIAIDEIGECANFWTNRDTVLLLLLRRRPPGSGLLLRHGHRVASCVAEIVEGRRKDSLDSTPTMDYETNRIRQQQPQQQRPRQHDSIRPSQPNCCCCQSSSFASAAPNEREKESGVKRRSVMTRKSVN